MAKDCPDIRAALSEIAQAPRRDNSAYHTAITQARQAFETAESVLGGPIELKTKTKLKRDGTYIVKWTFKRLK